MAVLEREVCDTEAIDTLFRMTHSIKGMAASLEYNAAAVISHALEDWLEPFRASGELPDTGFGLIYEVIATLEQMVSEVAETGQPPAPRDDLVEVLRTSGSTTSLVERRTDVVAPKRHWVRVGTKAVDRFLAGVGELRQQQARMEALHRQSPLWDLHGELGEELESMQRVVRDLRRHALEIRTTPVRRVLERLPRVASELARSLGKRVAVELVGEEVEVDRGVLDRLDDPLIHLIRNAVDHGIETPDLRTQAGKSAVGTIHVTARSESGRLRIRFADDGAGLDVEAVRRRAVERGMLPEAVAEDLPQERVVELLFEPSMSTRDEVSEVSGRGVGLDAVKRVVEALGGTIEVSSDAGHGMAFDLELPAMVALQRVLVLELRGERVALPVSGVEAVLGVEEGEVERAGAEAFFVWKDEPMPLIDLASRLGLESGPPALRRNVVVLEARDFKVGLEVDRVSAEHELFIRPVPQVLAGLEPLAGTAILPDGSPVFLIETGSLIEGSL